MLYDLSCETQAPQEIPWNFDACFWIQPEKLLVHAGNLSLSCFDMLRQGNQQYGVFLEVAKNEGLLVQA